MMIQGIQVTVDFHLLSLVGCDVVVGAQWLGTLGPIVWFFSELTM